MNESKLREILKKHDQWCATCGKQGQPARLKDCDLREVGQLWNTNLAFADMRGANLFNVRLLSCNLSNVILNKANLSGVHFSGSNLAGAILTDADCLDADFNSADMKFADFSNADLRRAKVTEVNVANTDFTNVNLAGATLLQLKNASEANWKGVKLADEYGKAIVDRKLLSQLPVNLVDKYRRDIFIAASSAEDDGIVRGSIAGSGSGTTRLPLAFICHDSQDKDDVVRELAHQLVRMGCPVWYDEYSLRVGDSLRKKIEGGIKECKKCILILSPRFLSNEGWTKAEFDSIYTKEIAEKGNVMLPVWHGVTTEMVYNYSPRLADRVGISTDLGITEVARQLQIAIEKT